MASKPHRKQTQLFAHKNTIEKRRKKEIHDSICKQGAQMCKTADIRAFALVGLDAQGRIHALWDTGSIIPLWAFPETIAAGLRRDIEESGVEETWVPPVLPLRG